MEEPFILSKWQVRDFYILIDPTKKEVMIIASRGGSKTYDCVKVGLFFASLGYGVVFFSAQAPMMMQPKLYLSSLTRHTFLRYAIEESLKEFVRFKNDGFFLIRNLTEGQVRGLHIDMILIDEESESDKDALDASYGTLSVSKLGKIVHMTTPKMGRPSHATWKRLTLSDPANLMKRPYQECPYITQATIDHARKTFPIWYFKQEFECEWMAPAGRVFNNVVHADFTKEITIENQARIWTRTVPHYGVDWNPVAGHFIAGSQWDRSKLVNFVTFEMNLGSDSTFAIETIWNLLFDSPNARVELEDGGTNIGFNQMYFRLVRERLSQGKLTEEQAKSITRRTYRREWDPLGKNKMNSITLLFPRTIMVDDMRTPEIADWLDKLSWDEEAVDNPKILKDPKMHPIDAYLHSEWIGMYAS